MVLQWPLLVWHGAAPAANCRCKLPLQTASSPFPGTQLSGFKKVGTLWRSLAVEVVYDAAHVAGSRLVLPRESERSQKWDSKWVLERDMVFSSCSFAAIQPARISTFDTKNGHLLTSLHCTYASIQIYFVITLIF